MKYLKWIAAAALISSTTGCIDNSPYGSGYGRPYVSNYGYSSGYEGYGYGNGQNPSGYYQQQTYFGQRYVGGYEYANSEVIVAMPPPPMRYEVVPIIPAARFEREYWQPGYWRWNGAQHVWRGGRYSERPRHGSVWVAGQWTARRGGWAYQNGHWT